MLSIYIGTYRCDQEIKELCIGIQFIKYIVLNINTY